jgi:hypothetical protein
MMALESVVGSLCLVWSGQYAHAANAKPSVAAKQLREMTVGSLLDTKDMTPVTRQRVRKHMDRLFDNLEKMTAHADLGFEN